MPSLFSKPKSVLPPLGGQQKQVLADVGKIEKKAHGDLKDKAIQRIVDLYLRPTLGAALSDREIERRAENLYQQCKRVLRDAPITTNIDVKAFMSEAFYLGDGLKAGWTVVNAKTQDYWKTRQKVEENAFGYKIDWSVPIAEAAKARPIYAGLNFSSHPYGAAAPYGALSFTYKPHVHQRCTFIAVDTFDNRLGFEGSDVAKIKESRLGLTTDARIGNLCATITDRQLKALCAVASGSYAFTDDPPNYIEAHIHMPVSFARDLAAIRIASTGQTTLARECTIAKRSEATVKYLIAAFAERYAVRASIYDKGTEVEVLHAG